MAKDVASGIVDFGHTNTLTGPQWVSAFMNALETGKPEWWDPQRRMLRQGKPCLRDEQRQNDSVDTKRDGH